MMKSTKISRSYALALYEAAPEDQRGFLLEQLSKLASIFLDKEICFFWRTPTISDSQKAELFLNALKKVGFTLDDTQQMDERSASVILKNFISLLMRKGRLMFLPQICEDFQFFLNDGHGVLEGVVYSVSELLDDDKKHLVAGVEKIIQKKVLFNYQIEPQLLGGLVAEVGSWRFDDSLKSHLKQLNDELKSNRRAN